MRGFLRPKEKKMARIQLQQAWIVGLLLLLLIQSLQPSNCEMGSSSRISSISSGTADGTEEWGYTDVRPGTISVPFLFFFLFSCCIPFFIEYPSIHNFRISCSPELALLCHAIIKFSPHILLPKHLHILGGCSCD